tara:strand:- start:1006 stop:1134 length:129 start_codon:yes stop_codon:yes gene_type:complete
MKLEISPLKNDKVNKMKDFLGALAIHILFAVVLVWLILLITG